MQCIAPIVLIRDEPNADGYYSDKVPCGKCATCQKRRAAQWIFRLQQELKRSTSAIFLTLTYEDEHVPLAKVQGHTTDLMTLDYSHHQKFLKRLRKAAYKSTQSLKYYAVGEYGENYERPHFHYILFNLEGYQKEELFLSSIWGKGKIDIGTVTAQSMAYVTGYVNKKIIKDKINDIRLPEKSFMSKGLGENYLTKETTFYYKRKLKGYLSTAGNQKISMPRYYKTKLYDSLEQVKVKSNTVLHLLEAELPERQQFELNKRAAQKGAQNDIWRKHKLLH